MRHPGGERRSVVFVVVVVVVLDEHLYRTVHLWRWAGRYDKRDRAIVCPVQWGEVNNDVSLFTTPSTDLMDASSRRPPATHNRIAKVTKQDVIYRRPNLHDNFILRWSVS